MVASRAFLGSSQGAPLTLRVRTNLWLISDTHFGHKNIAKFQQRPESHEVIMLSNWIDRVRDDDQILHLGDVFMGKQGNPDRWAKVISRLPGKKFVIRGNHDPTDDKLFTLAGLEVVEPFIWRPAGKFEGLRVAFTHEPIGTKWSPGGFALDEWDINIHGHIHRGRFGGNNRDFDGSPLPGKEYINISVEETNLSPVQLGNLIKRGAPT